MSKGFVCFSLAFCCLVSGILLLAVVAQSGITQTTATLSEARYAPAATSSGDLVFFGGGYNATGPSDRVDICNVTSGSWATATLSIPRCELAAASSGNLVFFGGGWDGNATYYNQVDIYNISDGVWSNASLSNLRAHLAATSVGYLVMFAGGYSPEGPSSIVDIYNVTSNTWTNATLSQARQYLAATSVANRYALFAGGWYGTNESIPSNVIDIFDSLNGVWNTFTLSKPRAYLAATSLGSLSFFGGGDNGSQASNAVDIFDSTNQTWNTTTLSQARYFLAAAAIGDIVAFGGGSDFPYNAVVDIYNMSNYIWFTANLSQPRYGLAATSSTNKIFFGGGNNSNSGCSNVVDIYPISLPFSPTVPANSVPSLTKAVPSYSPSICFPTSPAVSCPSQSTTLNPSTSPSNVSTHNTVALTNSALIGGLVGALTGALLLVGGIVVLVLLLLQKKRKNKKLKNERNIEELPIEEQTRETVVLENYTSTIALNETNITTLTAYQTETLKELSPGQIPFNELEIGKEIGEGTYGRVCVGKWKQYRVALKFCQNKGKMDEFMREANLMISLPPHPNVVRMYGVSIDGTQPIIVMEYCGGGSLDKILYDTNEKISMEQKIRWVHEIAKGMYHLHKYNIVHRDLAARNILLSHPDPNDAHAKISDFGMSRLLQQNMVGKTLNPIGPIRWMSPESIGQQVYSKKSDVWMFGVLVYEIIAQREPHTTMEPKQILILIRDEGLAPTIPSDCPQKLRELMQMCWKKQPEQRPNFEMICEMLQ